MNGHKAELITVDGIIREIVRPRDLQDLYALLNADTVERAKVRDYRDFKAKWLWVDEDGIANGKPVNALATRMYRQMYGEGTILGDAVLFTGWQGPGCK